MTTPFEDVAALPVITVDGEDYVSRYLVLERLAPVPPAKPLAVDWVKIGHEHNFVCVKCGEKQQRGVGGRW